MNDLNESSFPFPSDLCLTPNNQNTSADGPSIAPGAPVRPATARDRSGTLASARHITFAQEEIFTDDEEDEEEPILQEEEIRFLNNQNNILVAEYCRLQDLEEKERANIRVILARIRLIERKKLNVQKQSWVIADTLGRTEVEDYVGLE